MYYCQLTFSKLNNSMGPHKPDSHNRISIPRHSGLKVLLLFLSFFFSCRGDLYFIFNLLFSLGLLIQIAAWCTIDMHFPFSKTSFITKPMLGFESWASRIIGECTNHYYSSFNRISSVQIKVSSFKNKNILNYKQISDDS